MMFIARGFCRIIEDPDCVDGIGRPLKSMYFDEAANELIMHPETAKDLRLKIDKARFEFLGIRKVIPFPGRQT